MPSSDGSGAPMDAAAKVLLATARWLETNDHDYATLANGPLGEALTRQEIEAIARDEQAIADLIDYCREGASSIERQRGRIDVLAEGFRKMGVPDDR